MPSKADFQLLVDWCTQPSPDSELHRVVGAYLDQDFGEGNHSRYEGDLAYVPPNVSQWMPEHFSGVLAAPGGHASVLLTVGERYALGDFTWPHGWNELSIDSVEAHDSSILVVAFGSTDRFSVSMHLWGSYRHMA